MYIEKLKSNNLPPLFSTTLAFSDIRVSSISQIMCCLIDNTHNKFNDG